MDVELQLNRLKYPYHDSYILAKLISFNSNNRRFAPLIKKIFKKASIITNSLKSYKNKALLQGSEFYSLVSGHKSLKVHNSIPTLLTGLKIKISGRLTTQRVIPKKTISKLEKGGFKRTKNNIVDYQTYTNKNKKGSYTVKV